MNIIDAIEQKARKNHSKVGIGVGYERRGYVQKVVRAAEKASEYAEVVVVGKVNKIRKYSDIPAIDSTYVEKDLIGLLNKDKVDGVIRGSARASYALKEIKKVFNPKRIARIAILETFDGYPFFFAPVGIDEGWTREDKLFFIEEGIKLAKRIGIELKIGVLSGGRKQDQGRHAIADKTLADAEFIVKHVKEKFDNIKDYSILIEDAIEDRANYIIAPDGITGNLMFRTLAFLGGGRGLGAPLMGIEKNYVDTSRAQDTESYVKAIAIASALGR
jgi:putative methanogen marker protein 4